MKWNRNVSINLDYILVAELVKQNEGLSVGSVQSQSALAATSPPSNAYDLEADIESFKQQINEKDKTISRLEEEVKRLSQEVEAAKSTSLGENNEDFYDIDRFRA